MRRPRIQVLLDDTTLTPDICGALQRIDADIELSHLDPSAPARRTHSGMDARLVVTADAQSIANGRFSDFLAWCDRDRCATLVFSESCSDIDRLPGMVPTGLPIAFVSGLSRDDLAGRLSAMCGLQRPLHALQDELRALKRRDEVNRARLRRLDDQLRTAGRLQRDLQTAPPPVDGVDVATLYRPGGPISGDAFDVVRLDESHVAFVLIDATGHDLAAALLSLFVLRALRGREQRNGTYRLLDPDEVLRRVNDDILSLQLTDCQFVTAVYAVFDERSRVIRWARGGAPYPILARCGQPPRTIMSQGLLLGAVPDAPCEVMERKLEPGDTLVFYTDGLEMLLAPRRGQHMHGGLHRVEWFRTLNEEPLARHHQRLETRLSAIDEARTERDDITVITLRVDDRAPASHASGTHRIGYAPMNVPACSVSLPAQGEPDDALATVCPKTN